jgi:hypothetical protein
MPTRVVGEAVCEGAARDDVGVAELEPEEEDDTTDGVAVGDTGAAVVEGVRVGVPADGVAVVEDRCVGVAETDAARVPVAETETDGEPLVAADGVLVGGAADGVLVGVAEEDATELRLIEAVGETVMMMMMIEADGDPVNVAIDGDEVREGVGGERKGEFDTEADADADSTGDRDIEGIDELLADWVGELEGSDVGN